MKRKIIIYFEVFFCLTLLFSCNQGNINDALKNPMPEETERELRKEDDAREEEGYFIEWGKLKVPLYEVGIDSDWESLITVVDAKTFEKERNRYPIIRDKGERSWINKLSVAVAGDDMASLICKDGWNMKKCLFNTIRSANNGTTVYLVLRSGRNKAFYTAFSVSSNEEKSEVWYSEEISTFVNDEILDLNRNIAESLSVAKPVFKKKKYNRKRGAKNGYYGSSDLEIELIEDVFNFQFVHEKGNATLIKMDTTNHEVKWMAEQYRDSAKVEIIHIPNYKTVRRLIRVHDEIIPEKDIGFTNRLIDEAEDFDIHKLPEYYDFDEKKVRLNWRGMNAVINETKYAFDDFMNTKNDSLQLFVGDQELGIKRFELILIPKEGLCQRLISDRIDRPEIQKVLSNMEPETSIYFDGILVDIGEDNIRHFPLELVFNLE